MSRGRAERVLWYNYTYVISRLLRIFLVGILSVSTLSTALSQAHAESTASKRNAASRPALLAFAGIRGPINVRNLNRFFDASPKREKLIRSQTAPVRPAAAQKKRKPLKRQTLKQTRRPLVVPPPRATRAYRRTFRILSGRPDITDRYDRLILKYAHKFKLDPRLLKAIIAAESEFNKNARSPAGAMGLMQLMPLTGKEMGVHRSQLYDPEANIRGGAKYIAHLFKRAWRKFKLKGVRYQDAPIWVVQRVIAAYNAGSRFLYRTRWYRQTRHYVRKVLLFYQSDVTDIRRLPANHRDLPAFRLIRASTGIYN